METYGPYLEINLINLEKNFNTIKSKLLSSTRIIPVIKSNGYGSDGIIIARKLVTLGVNRFAVAYTREAIELKNAGIQTPIMIFYPIVFYATPVYLHYKYIRTTNNIYVSILFDYWVIVAVLRLSSILSKGFVWDLP